MAELQRENKLLIQGKAGQDQDALAAFAHQLQQAQKELSEWQQKADKLERDLKSSNQDFLDLQAGGAQELADANKSAALWKQAAESAEASMAEMVNEMQQLQDSAEKWKEAAESSDLSLQQLATEMAAAYEQ